MTPAVRDSIRTKDGKSATWTRSSLFTLPYSVIIPSGSKGSSVHGSRNAYSSPCSETWAYRLRAVVNTLQRSSCHFRRLIGLVSPMLDNIKGFRASTSRRESSRANSLKSHSRSVFRELWDALFRVSRGFFIGLLRIQRYCVYLHLAKISP